MPSPSSMLSLPLSLVKGVMWSALAFSGLALSFVPRVALSQQLRWQELGPPVRTHHSLVLDTRADRLILFGGTPNEDVLRNDVWTVNLQEATPVWRPLHVMGTAPAPRQGHSAVFDSLGNRMLVFGGKDPSGALNDAWVLELSGVPRWTQIHAGGVPPSPRWSAGAIWDAPEQRMLVIGGRGNGTHPKDSWALDLSGQATWSAFPIQPQQIYPFVITPEPWGRADYDPVTDRVFMTGNGRILSFELHAAEPAWTSLMDGWGAPPIAVDLLGRRVLRPYQSGLRQWEMNSDDGTISFNSTQLGPIPYEDGPRTDDGNAIVYDAKRGRCLVFGGTCSAQNSQGRFDPILWAFDLVGSGGWTPVTCRAPKQAFSPFFAHDPVRDRALLWSAGPERDFHVLWNRGLGSNDSWAALNDSAEAYALAGPANRTVYDPLRDRLVLFEGTFGGPTQLSQIPLQEPLVRTPIAFVGPAVPAGEDAEWASYDPVGDRLIVHGPGGHGDEPDQVWAIGLNGISSWTRLDTPEPRPSLNRAQLWLHDTASNRLLALALRPGDPSWSLDLGGNAPWTPFNAANQPSGVMLGFAMVDPNRHRAIVCRRPEGGTTEVWALDLVGTPTWHPLDTVGPAPQLPWYATGFYDSIRDRMLVYSDRSLFSLSLEDAPTSTRTTLLDATADERGIHVRWSVSDATDRCEVERSQGGRWTTRARLRDEAGVVEYTDADVEAGVEYSYRLRVPTRDGVVSTEAVTIVAQATASRASGLVAVHPNPSVGPVRVEWTSVRAGTAVIEVFDLRGRRVHQAIHVAIAGRNSWPLSLNGLHEGLYAVRVSQGAERHSARLVRIR